MSSLECEACQLGKHHRVSFPSRFESHRSNPFELVYSEIWDLARHKYLFGYSYLVIL